MPTRIPIRTIPPASRSRVLIARGALDTLGRAVRRATPAARVALVTDRTVAALYGARAMRSLRGAGFAVEAIVVPAGERSKQPARLESLWESFARAGLDRRDAVVALGGGVVGDLAGFAAATWLRGVPWVGVPTSLVAQVDSSIGGKTGVDLPTGKNLVGAFHPPAVVLVDPDLLETLPDRHRRSGLAEIVKTGMAVDATLFRWLEGHADALLERRGAAWTEVITRALRAKARVVRADEREREGGRRTALNYGHTLGHAIEAARGYRGILHGEAVAIGMRVAGRLSVEVARLPARQLERQDELLDAFGLPRRIPRTPIFGLMSAMALDKKRRGGEIRWVLTPRVGHASVPHPVDSRLVRATLRDFGAQV